MIPVAAFAQSSGSSSDASIVATLQQLVATLTQEVQAILSQQAAQSPAVANTAAVAASAAPVGTLDGLQSGAAAPTLQGWAYDPKSPSTSITVHIYVDGPASAANNYRNFVAAVSANASRPDVDSAYRITGNHGFYWPIPSSYYGSSHTFYAYGINTVSTGVNPLLSGAPKTIAVPAAASCSWNGQTIASGSSVSAYQASSVQSGSQCVSQTRTCTNGTLSGSYAYASCSVQQANASQIDNFTITPLVSCLSGPTSSNVITVTAPYQLPANSWLNMSDSQNLSNGWYSAVVAGDTVMQAPVGLSPSNTVAGMQPTLSIQPGKTYYVSLYDGTLGRNSVTKQFVIPQCSSTTGSTLTISDSVSHGIAGSYPIYVRSWPINSNTVFTGLSGTISTNSTANDFNEALFRLYTLPAGAACPSTSTNEHFTDWTPLFSAYPGLQQVVYSPLSTYILKWPTSGTVTFPINVSLPGGVSGTNCVVLFMSGSDAFTPNQPYTMTSNLSLQIAPASAPPSPLLSEIAMDDEQCFGANDGCGSYHTTDNNLTYARFSSPFTQSQTILGVHGNASAGAFNQAMASYFKGSVPTGAWTVTNTYYAIPNCAGLPSGVQLAGDWKSKIPANAITLFSKTESGTGMQAKQDAMDQNFSPGITIPAGGCLAHISSHTGNGSIDNESQELVDIRQ